MPFTACICEEGCGAVDPQVDSEGVLTGWLCPYCQHALGVTPLEQAVFQAAMRYSLGLGPSREKEVSDGERGTE